MIFTCVLGIFIDFITHYVIDIFKSCIIIGKSNALSIYKIFLIIR